MYLQLLVDAIGETFYMVLASSLIAILLGLPIGLILIATAKDGVMAHKISYSILSLIVNALRSIPFIILLVAITPLTELLTGTSIGTTAAIVPLSIGAMPFVARIVENAIHEIPNSLVEAGIAMGATPWQIIYKILLPEALPGIIEGVTVVVVSLVGYSAMAGAIGGGGLGEVGINYGYQRFNPGIMLATVLILILIVQLLQWVGDTASKKLRKH